MMRMISTSTITRCVMVADSCEPSFDCLSVAEAEAAESHTISVVMLIDNHKTLFHEPKRSLAMRMIQSVRNIAIITDFSCFKKWS